MYMLAKNPEKQEKLRQEIITKLPEKTSKLTPEMLKNVPYLRACLKEVARIKPIAPFNMRAAGQDLVIKGFRIPKGVRRIQKKRLSSKYFKFYFFFFKKQTEMVFASAYLQVSDNHYTSADKFIPERWLDDHSEVGVQSAKSVHPFVYLPFGFGVRTCIGKRIAELEMETLLARIVRNFRIEWHYGDIVYARKMLNIPSGDLKFRFVDL